MSWAQYQNKSFKTHPGQRDASSSNDGIYARHHQQQQDKGKGKEREQDLNADVDTGGIGAGNGVMIDEGNSNGEVRRGWIGKMVKSIFRFGREDESIA